MIQDIQDIGGWMNVYPAVDHWATILVHPRLTLSYIIHMCR